VDIIISSFVFFWVFSCVFLSCDCRGYAASRSNLGPLSPDAASELDVLGHDGDALGVDGAKVGVLEEANEVSLGSLLKSEDSGSLEPKVGLEVLGDLADEALEGELPDEELGGLLVPADLAKGDGSGAVPVGLLDSACGRSGLAGSLGGELLPGGLSSGGLTCGLLGTSHFDLLKGGGGEEGKEGRKLTKVWKSPRETNRKWIFSAYRRESFT